ncbi:hypothetical protein SKAU_G00337030 [Synaphobranchus kaupii]|uniref:Uncharacterized protein n=1 Tax=Synaphobranchus kaupii TaxID=118154 RepID=A0A9Q1EMA5_SYNKA|nr:hypothetical protein SKAU_G00337030 [Synaphobranchus kaupii]
MPCWLQYKAATDAIYTITPIQSGGVFRRPWRLVAWNVAEALKERESRCRLSGSRSNGSRMERTLFTGDRLSSSFINIREEESFKESSRLLRPWRRRPVYDSAVKVSRASHPEEGLYPPCVLGIHTETSLYHSCLQ